MAARTCTHAAAAAPDFSLCGVRRGGCDHQCVPGRQWAEFQCVCYEGYQLAADGQTCVVDFTEGVNECASGRTLCDDELAGLARCVDLPIGFMCVCQFSHMGVDFDMDTRKCAHRKVVAGDIAGLCEIMNGDCHQICVQGPEWYQKSCDCYEGFSLLSNGEQCQDIDECALDNGGCSDTCVNLHGDYECECPPGCVLKEDGKTCLEVLSCKVAKGLCSHYCQDASGVIKCSCYPGYQLAADNRTCLVESLVIETPPGRPCQFNNGRGRCAQVCTELGGEDYRCSCLPNYEVQRSNPNACIGNQKVALRIATTMPFRSGYTDPTSDTFKELEQEIRDKIPLGNFDPRLKISDLNIQLLQSNDGGTTIEIAFESSESNDLIARGEYMKLKMPLYTGLNNLQGSAAVASIELDGQQYRIISNPAAYIKNTQTGSGNSAADPGMGLGDSGNLVFELDLTSPCTSQPCPTGINCTVNSGVPICNCPVGLRGPFCEESTSDIVELIRTEAGAAIEERVSAGDGATANSLLLALVPLATLALIFSLIGLGVALCGRRRKKTVVVQELEEETDEPRYDRLRVWRGVYGYPTPRPPQQAGLPW